MRVSRRLSFAGVPLATVALALFMSAAAQAATFTVNSTADSPDADPTDGVCASVADAKCTLRAAVDEANAQLTDDTIQLAADTYRLSNAGGGEDKNATGDLDVQNAGSLDILGATTNRDDTVISGSDGETSTDRVLHLLGHADVTVQYVTIRDGNTKDVKPDVSGNQGEEGAGILVNKGATLNLTDSRVTKNDAGRGEAGGGIRSEGSNAAAARPTVNITRSLIDHNRATDGGGGFDNNGDASVIDSTFEFNDTCGPEPSLLVPVDAPTCLPGEGGGAIRQAEHANSLYVSGSTFKNNDSGDDGGAIEHHEADPGSTAVIVDSTFTANTAVDDGGAIGNSTGSLDISGSTFTGNEAFARVSPDRCRDDEDSNNWPCPDHGGGAVWSEGVNVRIADSTLKENKSHLSGGGVYIEQGRLDIVRSTLKANQAEQTGGGVYMEQFTDLRVGSSLDNHTRLFVSGSTIESNVARANCVFTTHGTEAQDAYFCDRDEQGDNGPTFYSTNDPVPTTSKGGGGIYNRGQHFEIVDSHIDNNSAGNIDAQQQTPHGDGGGIYNEGGELRLVRSSVDGNKAADNGGGLIQTTDADPLSSVSNSISGNTAQHGNGGGIYDGANNSGDLESPDTLIINTTLSGNEASNGLGGGYFVGGTDFGHSSSGAVSFVNATIADNTSTSEVPSVAPPLPGGGIFHGGTKVYLKNTLLNGNHEGDCGGKSVISRGGNMDSDGTCSLSPTTDQPNVLDAKIGLLADNGGGTRTRALADDSPAVDKADNRDCPPLDQRGGLRPPPPGSAGSTCDVGAYEGHSLADLGITKSDSPDPVTAGGNVTYTLTVTNNGPDGANLVSVRDDLPAGVTLVSAGASQGSCSGGGPVVCGLGSIAKGGSATITIVVKTGAAGTITNTASVDAPLTDPEEANDTASASTVVSAPPVAGAAAPPAPSECSPIAPRTSISRNALIGERARLKFTGRSIDLRCLGQGASGGIRNVRVAVSLKERGRCRFVTRSGDLTRLRACDSRVFMNARLGEVRNGKVPWTFLARRLNLPAGKYTVVAFGTDSQGTEETQTRRFNLKRFEIR